MPTYDSVRYSPPAPVATVELRDTGTGRVLGTVPMQLDTGSDVTLLPRTRIEQFNIPLDSAQVYHLMGFDGNRSTAVGIHLDVIFAGICFRGRYLVSDQPDGILGRDVLNHLHVTFNGPLLTWDRVI